MHRELTKEYVNVKGLKMAYTDVGASEAGKSTLLFLHGNPTSSYLWRNIVHHLKDSYRCVAIDLIGMGDSDKLPNSDASSYTFVQHYEYLSQAIDELGLNSGKVTLVIHDWGSALGFNWAYEHPEAVAGICYMEAIVAAIESWDEWPENARSIFQGFRSEAGESLCLDKNVFVERVLPSSIIRDLTETEMAEYLRPFKQPGEDRRPTLTWPRQIPIAGEPVQVVEIVNRYNDFMAKSPVPKLFINADPGSILVGKARDNCRKWPNQEEVTVKGLHFLQEDSADEIAAALQDWLKTSDTK